MDKKVQNHIKGVRVAGFAGWRAALEELERFTTEGEIFVAASAALSFSQNEISIKTLLDKASEEPVLKRGLLSACAWYDIKDASPVLHRFFQSSSTQ